MIKFRCFKRHPDGTPIIRDADIVKFAESQLRDYRPELLEVPGKIDPIHDQADEHQEQNQLELNR